MNSTYEENEKKRSRPQKKYDWKQFFQSKLDVPYCFIRDSLQLLMFYNMQRKEQRRKDAEQICNSSPGLQIELHSPAFHQVERQQVGIPPVNKKEGLYNSTYQMEFPVRKLYRKLQNSQALEPSVVQPGYTNQEQHILNKFSHANSQLVWHYAKQYQPL